MRVLYIAALLSMGILLATAYFVLRGIRRKNQVEIEAETSDAELDGQPYGLGAHRTKEQPLKTKSLALDGGHHAPRLADRERKLPTPVPSPVHASIPSPTPAHIAATTPTSVHPSAPLPVLLPTPAPAPPLAESQLAIDDVVHEALPSQPLAESTANFLEAAPSKIAAAADITLPLTSPDLAPPLTPADIASPQPVPPRPTPRKFVPQPAYDWLSAPVHSPSTPGSQPLPDPASFSGPSSSSNPSSFSSPERVSCSSISSGSSSASGPGRSFYIALLQGLMLGATLALLAHAQTHPPKD